MEAWEWRGAHSHAQIRQGIGSEDEGFVHVMGELEHTAREQRAFPQPGCAHLEPGEAAPQSQLPAASTPPLPSPRISLSLPTTQPVTPRT